MFAFLPLESDFSCCFDCSDALQKSMALSRLRSAIRSRRSQSVSLRIPQTILSRISPSLRSLNSHVAASVRRAVKYWSIVSPSCCTLVLKLCRSNVKFFLCSQ